MLDKTLISCHNFRVKVIICRYTHTYLVNPNPVNALHYWHIHPLHLCSWLVLLCSSRWVKLLGGDGDIIATYCGKQHLSLHFSVF